MEGLTSSISPRSPMVMMAVTAELQDAAELGRLRRRRGGLTWFLCHYGLPTLLQLARDRVTTPVRAMATMRVGQVVN